MKKFLLFFFAGLFMASFGMAQMGTRPGAGGGMGQSGKLYGKVVDSVSHRGIPGAVIELVSRNINPRTGNVRDTTLVTMLSEGNGDFSFDNLPIIGNYRLIVSAIGFSAREIRASFLDERTEEKLMAAMTSVRTQSTDGTPGKTMADVIREVFGGDMSALSGLSFKDVGNVTLQPEIKALENVTVVGSRPMMSMGIDRKIFTVDRAISSSGSTAVDVLKQIPAVNVDIDGNVSVRNSAPTVFVDGRPTTLTLDQIPADEIQSIELITNPSAKYDASGGMASILNVVMKKNRRIGYNGTVRAGVDSRGQPNGGGDINLRQGKLNFFASGNISNRKNLGESDVTTNYFARGLSPAVTIRQIADNENGGSFRMGRAGIDYLPDNRNTFTLSGMMMRGSFDGEDYNQMFFDSLYAPAIRTTGIRETFFDRKMRNQGATFSYKHLFPKQGTELTADINYFSNQSEGGSSFNNTSFNSSGQQVGNVLRQQNTSKGNSSFLVGQIDYTNKLNSLIKMDLGARYQTRDFYSENNNSIYDYTGGKFISMPALNSAYEFLDAVAAAYITLSGKLKEDGKLGYNAGLRAESSNYDGNIPGTTNKFKVEYPVSLFPSAFLSYQLNDKADVQFNYTRRINRPNFFQLMPFVDYNDPLNLNVGNAGLTPEFTNSIEANFSQQFNQGHTLLSTIYFKNTNNLITRYQYKGLNPITMDSAIYNSWTNANSGLAYGLELTSSNRFGKKFDAVTNVNLYNSTIKSNLFGQDDEISRWSFFGKLTLTQRLGKTNAWTLQMNGTYQGKTVLSPNTGGGGRGMFGPPMTAGTNGYILPHYVVDMSVRRDIIKNKNNGGGYRGSLTLSVNDVFKSRKIEMYNFNPFFDQQSSRIRDQQVFRLQFNYRFGKMDSSLFRRKNTRGDAEGMNEGMNMQ